MQLNYLPAYIQECHIKHT
uniref:Uncharacterized protein n=1 Tax=Anguilla anguilla TaxID=7936 RepID=A0A0E9RL69_ANGAN